MTTTVLWAVLAVVGQGAALSLIVAGHGVGYQHYLPVGDLPTHPVALALLVFQALVVAWGLRGSMAGLFASLRAALPGWRWMALGIALVLASATVGHDLRRYALELLTASIIQLVSLANVALFALSIPEGALARLRSGFAALLGDDGPAGEDVPPRLDRLTVVTAMAVTVVCAILAIVVYGRHPHLQDEVAYLFQARTFASGRIALPAPPVPRAFELYLIDVGARGWYSPVPPGWAAVLAGGVIVRAAWLVNPLLTGLNVILCSLVLQPVYGRRVARLATLLFAVSPWNLFLGMSLMPHAVTLACALLAALGVITTRRTGLAIWSWLGGGALGLIAAVRQLDAMIAALALGLWAVGLGGRRLRFGGVAGLVLGSMAVAAPLLTYNRYFTGRPGKFPIMSYNDSLYGKGANDYGFGANRGMGWALDPNPGHDPIDGMINADLNTTASEVELFGWATGSLLLLGALVLAGRLNRGDRLMLGVIALTFGCYFLNYFAGGPDFGARYWYLMVVPMVALTARAALSLAATAEGAPNARLLAAMALLVVSAVTTFMPWRARDKYWHYRGMMPDVPVLAEQRHLGRSLVLVRGREVPDYASAATYNPLDLSADAPVYARRRDAGTDSAVVAAFRDRTVWFMDGPTVTGAGYAISAGPLSPDQAMARIAQDTTSP